MQCFVRRMNKRQSIVDTDHIVSTYYKSVVSDTPTLKVNLCIPMYVVVIETTLLKPTHNFNVFE